MIRNHVPASEVIRRLREGARAAVDAVSEVAVQELKEMTGIQGPPRSLPDQAPRMDTGALNESIGSQPYTEPGVEGRVIGEDTPYSLALEFGYPENNLAPRPHQSTEMKSIQSDSRYSELAAEKLSESITR